MATKKKASIALMPDAGLQWDKAVFTPVAPDPVAAEEEAPSGTLGRAADFGRTAVKAMIGVPEAAVGLVDLVTGGRVGRNLENIGFRPGAAKQMLDQAMTPEHKAAFREVHEADGIIGTAFAVAKNPSVLLHAVTESIPMMGAGGVVARGALALMPKIGTKIAAGLGEGVTAMGASAEHIRQQTPGGTLTGMQSVIAAGSGALTGALGVIGSKVAQKFGITDVDVLLAGKANQEVTKGFVRRVLEGAVAEGILEELPQSAQEQVAQNMALGKPLDEGLDQAIVLGTLAGGLMGAGANAFATTPAGDIRSEKLPGSGPLTTAVNAGIEGKAQAIEAAIPPPPATPLAPPEIDPESFVPAVPDVEPQPVMRKLRPASDPGAVAQREADKPPEPTESMTDGDIGTKAGTPFTSMRNAMRALEQAGGEATHELARVVGGLVVRPKKAVDADVAQPDADGVLGDVDGTRGPGAEQLRDGEPGRLDQSATAPVGESAASLDANELRPDADTKPANALTPDAELPMGQPPGGEARIVKVGDREYQLTPDQRTELEAVEAEFKQKFDAAQAVYERTKSAPLPDNPDVGLRGPKERLAAERKALGFKLSAERRRIVGAMTPKELAAKAAAEKRMQAGQAVQTPDGQGVVAGVAFGKVRVTVNGTTKAYKRDDVGSVSKIDTSSEPVQETEKTEQVAPAPEQAAQAPEGPGASRATPDVGATNPPPSAETSDPQAAVGVAPAQALVEDAPTDERTSPRQRRADKAAAREAPEALRAEVVDHVTAKGKTIRGVWRAGLTSDEAIAIDSGTFKRDGKHFIRERSLNKLAAHDAAKVAEPDIQDSQAPKADAPAPSAKPAPNTVFTEDAAAAARARLKAKLGRAQSGIDPETMMDGITLAGYHIEKGARSFAAYARAMVDDLGDAVKPYLQSWYMAVRADPRAGEFRAGMDKASAVEDLDMDAVLAATATKANQPDAERAKPDDGPTAEQPAQPDEPPIDVLTFTEDQTAALGGQTVEIEVSVGDTGQTAVLKMDAAEAVRDVKTRLAAAEELLGCLK